MATIGFRPTLHRVVSEHPHVASGVLTALLFLSCYFRLFIFPHTPVLPGGDAIGFFATGERIARGELPYRDFFEFLPVGTDLSYAVLIKMFGFRNWVPDLAMAAIMALVVLLTTLAARRLMFGVATLLPALLVASFALSNESLNATHHWFCCIAAMTALVVLLGGTTSARIVMAGVLVGIAASFTQTKGIAVTAAFVIYLIWWKKSRRQAALLLIAAVTIFALINGYFIAKAGLHEWLFSVVVFPARYFPAPAFNNWRVIKTDFSQHFTPGGFLSFPFVYATMPWVYVLFFAMVFKRSKRVQPALDTDVSDGSNEVTLVALTGAALFLAVAPSPALWRLASASPPAMILLTWLVRQSKPARRTLTCLFAIGGIAVAIGLPLHRQIQWHATLKLPGGRTAFDDPFTYQEYRWLASVTQPGQYAFATPAMYSSFQMANAAPLLRIEATDYTRPQQVNACLRAFDDHAVPLIITRGTLDEPLQSSSDHSQPYRNYIHANYRVAAVFPNHDVAWERISR